MNYFRPMQRINDSKWDYTCNSRPTGYCHEFLDIDPEKIHISEQQLQEYRDRASKYHTCGHETELEARECYKEWMLDNQLSLHHKDPNQQRKCQICGEWTQLFVTVDYSIYELCEKHHDREHVSQLMVAPAEMWCS